MAGFADSMAVIRTHCTTAGNAIAPKITTVRLCDLQVIERQMTVEYDGFTDNPLIPTTFGTSSRGQRVSVKVWLPVSNLDKGPLEAVEAQLQDVMARIVAAIEGDLNLGGNCSCVLIEDGTTGKEQFVGPDQTKGPVFRTGTIPLILTFTDVNTLAL